MKQEQEVRDATAPFRTKGVGPRADPKPVRISSALVLRALWVGTDEGLQGWDSPQSHAGLCRF